MQKLTHGFLKEIYDKCKAHFVSTIDPALHAAAYVGEYRDVGFAESEFAGKYMDVCVSFYRQTGDERLLENARTVADSVLRNQRPDGYIGGYAAGYEWTKFSVWNQAFTAIGMISVSEATGEEKYLASAERSVTYIARHFLDTEDSILNAQNYGAQHLAILIPTAMLCIKTKKAVYREFFEKVLQTMRGSTNDFTHFESILELQSKKAIENLCCLIGMLIYAKETNDQGVIASMRQYWQELADTQICETGNGTTRELWRENGNAPGFRPVEECPNETCVAVGWAELSMLLYELDGTSNYLDKIEQTLFNHLLGALDSSCCDFGYYQPNFGSRITRTAEDVYKCCRYRGFSAVAAIPSHLFGEAGDQITPLIYTNADFANDRIRITEETDYPFDGRIKFTVTGHGSLRLRIPAWCKSYKLLRNGAPCNAAVQNGFVTLSGDWSSDEVIFEPEMQPIQKTVAIEGVDYAGITYGPVVCALERPTAGEIFNAELDASAPLGRVEPDGCRLRFRAAGALNGKPCVLDLVDYPSAGRAPGSEYTVWVKLL